MASFDLSLPTHHSLQATSKDEEEEEEDPTLIISFASEASIHLALACPGVLTIPGMLNVPQLQPGHTAEDSKLNLQRWVDAIVADSAPNAKQHRLRGKLVPGHFDRLTSPQAHEVTAKIGACTQWILELDAAAPPQTCGTCSLIWGSTSSVVPIGPFRF